MAWKNAGWGILVCFTAACAQSGPSGSSAGAREPAEGSTSSSTTTPSTTAPQGGNAGAGATAGAAAGAGGTSTPAVDPAVKGPPATTPAPGAGSVGAGPLQGSGSSANAKGGSGIHPCAAILCAAGKVCTVLPNGTGACVDQKTEGGPKQGAAKPCVKTGCGGTVCADESVMTTCEYRPEHACYQNAVCERDATGKCAFRASNELSSCVARAKK